MLRGLLGFQCVVFSDSASGQQSFDDLTMNIGETKIPSLKTIGQSLVIQSQPMENGGVKVMNVNLVRDDMKTKIIGVTKCDAWLDTSSRHVDAKCLRVVIAPVATVALDHWCPAEFTTPNDQCVIEQPAVLQITNQSCTTSIGCLAVSSQVTVLLWQWPIIF